MDKETFESNYTNTVIIFFFDVEYILLIFYFSLFGGCIDWLPLKTCVYLYNVVVVVVKVLVLVPGLEHKVFYISGKHFVGEQFP